MLFVNLPGKDGCRGHLEGGYEKNQRGSEMAMKILDDLILPLNFEVGVRDIRQGANFRQIRGVKRLTMMR